MPAPPILFLDEPITGLDPLSRTTLLATIRGLARDGTTVLLTTQYLEEADALADVAAHEAGRGAVNEIVAVEYQDRAAVGARQLLRALADQVHHRPEIEVGGDNVPLGFQDPAQSLVLVDRLLHQGNGFHPEIHPGTIDPARYPAPPPTR